MDLPFRSLTGYFQVIIIACTFEAVHVSGQCCLDVSASLLGEQFEQRPLPGGDNLVLRGVAHGCARII